MMEGCLEGCSYLTMLLSCLVLFTEAGEGSLLFSFQPPGRVGSKQEPQRRTSGLPAAMVCRPVQVLMPRLVVVLLVVVLLVAVLLVVALLVLNTDTAIGGTAGDGTAGTDTAIGGTAGGGTAILCTACAGTAIGGTAGRGTTDSVSLLLVVLLVVLWVLKLLLMVLLAGYGRWLYCWY